ncbi:MAG: hypothetical protein H6Q00_287 [Holophagaceae bacterium]|nr:hypothetical protein [Holophagaceae bacterium]
MEGPTQEHQRLADARPWRRWGPYLGDRQWGTVREDYSPDGSSWEAFPFEQAHLRAYRWGEDGLAGFCDEAQRLCLGLVLWNGADPILKERLFGLTNREGNHGEDVKEHYYHLDALPSGAYQKMLYRYPQRAFPYERLRDENRRRGPWFPEFELADTGVLEGDRFFDVLVEYAKGDPEDILLQLTVQNRGPEPASLHVLPQLWFRNTWSWDGSERPTIQAVDETRATARHPRLKSMHLHVEPGAEWLFCDNETHTQALYGSPGPSYPKDAFHRFLIQGEAEAVNPARWGTKAAAHRCLSVGPGESRILRVRLGRHELEDAFGDFQAILEARRQEADAFYDRILGPSDPEARRIQRQALAGLLWSRKFYNFDVPLWLAGDPAQPSPPPGRTRNAEWTHLNNAEILSLPDAWEYPWYAAWDLAFHCLPLAMVDPGFAKEQLVLLTREWYMHPNGQLPAYEWAFGDVNPPVHAWAAWRVYQMDGDRAFLERIFHKLLLNFTWWVNRKDPDGQNVFQGGFLGLDNIGVFDRSSELPQGRVHQADGTAWMAMYSLNMMRIALELALENPVYEDTATKFFEHFLYIAKAMTSMGHSGVALWDEEDEFFYDVLETPEGRHEHLKIRSMVGLIPFFAVEVLDSALLERLPEFHRRMKWFLKYRPDLAGLVSRWEEPGQGERHLLSLLRGHRMKRILARMLDEGEFLSPHGVRSLSRFHRDHPYAFCDERGFCTQQVKYQPGDSDTRLFGGNSNWRGPVWFPVNFLILESLEKFHSYYGSEFRVECPTGSGKRLSLGEIRGELQGRLSSLFLADGQGRRPAVESLHQDAEGCPLPLFHEFFHGETGRGLGASHQTGWTALIAQILHSAATGR